LDTKILEKATPVYDLLLEQQKPPTPLRRSTVHSILIVDDDPWIRSLLQRFCEKMGHATILASNGDLGWTILQDNPHIELVILDMQMPGLNGRELTEKIRAEPQHDNLPIIMVSGFVQAHEVSSILHHGVNRFVPKPIDPIAIQQYIADMLEIAVAA
jgi:CheY-like chemotaxis protein